jgi:hypothetical protein
MYITKQYDGNRNINGTEITIFYCENNAEHEDELVLGRESTEQITKHSGYYEANISGTNKAFHKSKNEPQSIQANKLQLYDN